MELMIVIAAAIAAWVAGAIWYMMLAGPWIRVSGVQVDNSGKPANGSAKPYLISGVAMLVISLMMNHFWHMAGISSITAGLFNGLGIGALIVAPWMLINNSYVQRPLMLTLIDGGYAVLACGVMGLILGAV